jgi:YegS/Rv2252/BmrU family lipid kinase
VIFAAGGDGTLSQVAGGIIGTNTALAVLPSGTGNVMGRQLGLPVPGGLWPQTFVHNAHTLLQGQIRLIDVSQVRVSGGGPATYSLCWVGVGFDAQVNLTVHEEPQRKQRLGMLAFVVAAIITLRDYVGTAAHLYVDEHPVNRRIVMAVANNIQLYGGWFKMAPCALLDDGLLDLYVFRGRGPARTALHGLRLLFSQHLQDPEVAMYRASCVRVRTRRPMPVHVDGEPAGYTPVTIAVIPRALRMLIPPTAPAGLFSPVESTCQAEQAD